jgi:hypothetical protein
MSSRSVRSRLVGLALVAGAVSIGTPAQAAVTVIPKPASLHQRGAGFALTPGTRGGSAPRATG